MLHKKVLYYKNKLFSVSCLTNFCLIVRKNKAAHCHCVELVRLSLLIFLLENDASICRNPFNLVTYLSHICMYICT